MGGLGKTIVKESGQVKLEPILGTLQQWEKGLRENTVRGKDEHGALFNENGEPIVGYIGNSTSVAVDQRVLNMPNGSFTHYHPDRTGFGGTLSMADLGVFAKSQLKELRAVSNSGQLYAIRATDNVDRKGLAKWVQTHEGMAQSNFEKSYRSALKQATTPLKSGPHKGQVKLVNRRTGKVVYRDPMTKAQAIRYARQYSTGMFDRMYQKALSKFGVTYVATKAGK